MIYKKVSVEFIEFAERFNRILLLREDINLVKLGCVFCTALGTAFEHSFYFEAGKKKYLLDNFKDYGCLDKENNLKMKNFKLKDLGNSFKFCYDTGDGWDFDCLVIEEKQLDEDRLAYLIDGKGQGVWEDNKYTLCKYLSGEIPGNSSKQNMREGIVFPWNHKITRYDDFDTAFDIENERIRFNLCLDINISDFINDNQENGFELGVDVNDFNEKVNPLLNDAILMFIDSQIKEDGYIKEKYLEFKEKYKNIDSMEMFKFSLKQELLNVICSDRFLNEYKKRVKKIGNR